MGKEVAWAALEKVLCALLTDAGADQALGRVRVVQRDAGAWDFAAEGPTGGIMLRQLETREVVSAWKAAMEKRGGGQLAEIEPGALLAEVARFHAAILGTDRTRLPLQLREFPRGACGDTSDLLGMYLTEKGFPEVQYVSGNWYPPGESAHHSHAWLEVGGFTVDITAYQFPEVAEQVLVTRESPWHRRFEGVTRRAAGTQGWPHDSDVRRMLSRAYRKIRGSLATD